jgi:hypothetical protein
MPTSTPWQTRLISFDVAASPQHQTKKIVISLLPQAKNALVQQEH